MNVAVRAHPLRLVSLLALLSILVMAAIAPAASAIERDSPAIVEAVEWLRDQQIDDGSFSAFGDEGDPGTTADVVFAFVAAGIDPASVESASGASPIDYLIEQANATVADPGLAGKVVLALVAAGSDPRDAGGADLIAAIQDGFDAESGFYGVGASNHTYALLALSAAGETPANGAIDALLNSQIEDGSWGFTGEPVQGTGDSNTTALIIQALVALDTGDDAIEAGLEYLRSLQDESGAIAYDASEAPDLMGDANSTSVAAQAFVAAGEDASPLLEALAEFQNPGGGFFWRGDVPDDSLLATAQAVPALLEKPLPLRPPSDASNGTIGSNRAGLVVRMGDGTLHYATVEFDEDSIEGIELLTRSGLDVSIAPFGGLGAAVCSIEGEGCPSDNCFCHSYSNPSYFWHYYVLDNGSWVEHPAGPSSRKLSDGDVDGWSWTADEPGLPVTTFEEIAAGSTSAGGDVTGDDRSSTYLIFGGMVALVIVIGGYGFVRSRKSAT